jgi:SAM-dependent methyltransferase
MVRLLQSDSTRNAKRDRVLELVAKASRQPNDFETKEIVDYLFDRREYIDAARWLSSQTSLAFYDPDQLLNFRDRFPRPYLNIGGGPTFAYPFWENLDSAVGPLNPKPFYLGPDVLLPFKAHSLELVYTSHAMEHLDDDTVAMTLAEAHRILRPGAPILVKIPDFDATLEAAHTADSGFFRDEWWNFGACTATFKNRSNVVDGLVSRAAIVFCSYWNKQYGDNFTDCDPSAPGAYHGPAPVGDAELSRIMRENSPHEAAAVMKRRVCEIEKDEITWNHQNAWSTEEMSSLLASHGFEMISTDKRKIVARYNFVPRLRELYEISAFFLAAAK